MLKIQYRVNSVVSDDFGGKYLPQQPVQHLYPAGQQPGRTAGTPEIIVTILERSTRK